MRARDNLTLEQLSRGRLFSRVPQSRLVVGLRVGLITGAATIGVLIGLGLRHGSALAPFQLYGRMTSAALTGFVPSPTVAVVVGLAGHLYWMVVLGTGFALVARSPRLVPLTIAALLCSAIAGWLAMRMLPSLLGAAAVASLTTGQLLFFQAVLALALVAGMRIAVK